MANPGTFADLGKEARETLLRGKDFSTKNTVDLVTTSSNGVKVTAKLSREDSGSLLGSLEAKFPKANGVEGSLTLDSANKAKGSISVADKLFSGLKATLGGELDISKSDQLVKAGIEYKRPRLTHAFTFHIPVKREIKDPLADTPFVNASLVLGYEEYGLAGGAEVDYVLDTNSLKTENATLVWRNGDFVGTGFYKGKAGKKPSQSVGANFYSKLHKSNWENTEVAAEIAYDLKADKEPVTVTGGIGFDAYKDSRINATLDNKGKLIATLTHRLNPVTKLKLGAEATPLLDAPTRFFFGLSFTE